MIFGLKGFNHWPTNLIALALILIALLGKWYGKFSDEIVLAISTSALPFLFIAPKPKTTE